ncbi:alpha/beta fold hydrolase [Amycolatopsis jiangsuensis]|uniref:Pimeloyl-ACP methyl ester carboxylesterase n=1 Tax=Amycolatopsis jiangsuensis TaxID=1181879 RepID=A0A840IYS0_9PSEU|nr:alpha/beta fold hydrolase [Amycolatopsis jiangsuensis]MBB4686437.1 pimeloyl-ACP methyl ester carboxylesterase [Amycolatopsis jiangsuensis]
MRIKHLIGPALAGLLLVPFAPGVATAADSLQWTPCRDIADGWPAEDQRTECASISVPVDYAKPDGRTFDLAVSRIKATGSRDGVVLTNPGGPGASGMDMPRSLLNTKAAGIGVHHDLIGFSPRGVGYSAGLSCRHDDAEPDPSLSDKEKARFESEKNAQHYQDCVAKDPEFMANLTTANVARDMDRIRQALGEDRIGYYGISWGTALGAEYRTLFDDHVDAMLLDSVVSPVFDLTRTDHDQMAALENSFHDFAGWLAGNDRVYHFGATKEAATQALLDLRANAADREEVDNLLTQRRPDWPESAGKLVELRSGAKVSSAVPGPATADRTGFDWHDPNPGFNPDQEDALLCNEATGTRDFETAWRNHLALSAELPIAGSHGQYDGKCAGWPLPTTPWHFTPGKSPLQLVGHTYESVTPFSWAQEMHARIGGSLLTVEDDIHGSLSLLPCASKAVEFFDTGKTSDSTCPGLPIPPTG